MAYRACAHGTFSEFCMACLADELALEQRIVEELVQEVRRKQYSQDDKDGGD